MRALAIVPAWNEERHLPALLEVEDPEEDLADELPVVALPGVIGDEELDPLAAVAKAALRRAIGARKAGMPIARRSRRLTRVCRCSET